LENIEAKLEAHRMAMQPLEEEYFHSRGKAPPQHSQLKFRQDIDQDYKEMETQQVYQLIREKQQEGDREDHEQQSLEQMWEERKRADPKLAEYDQQYQQFLVEKQARKMISSVVRDKLFTWQKYSNHPPKQNVKSKDKTKSMAFVSNVSVSP
jgi:hypothetical protein